VITAPITVEIRADALRANIAAVRRRLPPGTSICAAVKASAYGHGISQVLPVLAEAGVERVAVANLPEAAEVRDLGWSRPVLCLGAALVAQSEHHRLERARAAIDLGLNCTISTLIEARLLSTAAVMAGRIAHIEVKVDTGMGRMGERSDAAEQLIVAAAALPAVTIEGVYTHFATADDADLAFTREQTRRFIDLKAKLQARHIRVGRYHAANSAATFRLPEAHFDMCRPGLALYGCWAGPDEERPSDLTPIMRVVGRLAAVRRLPAGHDIGYGCSFRTTRPSVIGVVPIGYADGYRRSLSNDAVMTLEAARGQQRRTVPVVGRISMDLTTVDVTDAGDVRVGDRIVIIDSHPAAPNSVESLARKLDTIPYEVTCLLGPRGPRMLVL
jgi:alanine racemase